MQASDVEQKPENMPSEVLSPVRKQWSMGRFKSILLNVVNLILIAIILFVTSKYTGLAQEIKVHKSELLAAKEVSDVAVLKADIEKTQDKIDSLESIFVDEREFLVFLQRIEELKEQSVIYSIGYPNSEPSVDSGRHLGIPVSIEIRGSKEEIGSKLSIVEKLPYILRPVEVELVRVPEDSSYILKYGVFLYVDKSLKEN